MAEEKATKVALIRDYDDIQARIEADNILAARLQEEEREKFTIEERAKLLHDTIAAQRRFLAQQRAAEIRSKLPIRTQLRNQMMTYLKHVGRKKHSDLKTNNFEEKQVLYEKVKRSDENFIAIGSAEDERRIKDVNKKAIGIKKDDNTKEEDKEEESTRKRKLGTRKKIKSRKRRFKQDTSQDDQTDSERENDELRLCLTIAIDEDKEVDYEILDKKYPIIEWKMSTLELNHITEIMAKTMELYMSKTCGEYGLGFARPKIDANAQFEIKGQFLKELRDNTFSGPEHEDANEHIEKVLQIIDLFHIPNVTQDQVMLHAFPVSLTGAASRWLRNKPAGSIIT
ncbi:hypothetical protein Tco_0689158 [Tanacetum coccineum]